ncbi:MAG: protein TolR [Hyphomicrobiales bacterium]|nr:protein TolR [Hyphomicrobiales bacterium]
MSIQLNSRNRSTRLIGRRTQPMSDINVTPFVDVMLVLLVIFMITAPLLTSGVQVDLPSTEAGPIDGSDEPVTISVDREGVIYVGDTEVTLDGLANRLQAIAGNNAEIRVFVRGDQAIGYGRIMDVVGTVYNAGFHKVALLTDSKQVASGTDIPSASKP